MLSGENKRAGLPSEKSDRCYPDKINGPVYFQKKRKKGKKTGFKNDICRFGGSMREHRKHPVELLCFSPDYVRKIVAVLKRGSSVFLFKSRMFCKKKNARLF